jgi:hypothetical protein
LAPGSSLVDMAVRHFVCAGSWKGVDPSGATCPQRISATQPTAQLPVYNFSRRGCVMKRPLLILACVLLVVIGIAGCVAGNRQLESLSVSPASSSANGSAVQFTATGHWSLTPTTVMPQAATWGACTDDGVPTSNVTVSTTGLATCASGATGTYMIFAWDPDYGYTGPECLAITACGGGCGRVSATSQLTCP